MNIKKFNSLNRNNYLIAYKVLYLFKMWFNANIRIRQGGAL